VEFCPTKALDYVPADAISLQKKKEFSARFAKIAQEVSE